ncbi:MAG: hypothetical protein HS104_02730 [Polyangiaceae bacterium]|nr:hypothetical protein [Polyangiaceae bacterium]MCE7894440.1 hypothetical protein [Sorangiineae bacterium PRO1]MCL4751201.1 hypothetical protein [Myxococcales bacterium]
MRVWRSLLLSLALAAAATPLRAQECDQGAETCGRLEFEAGIEAYRTQRWADAAAHFEAAQKLRPHPVVLFNWALAQSKLRRYVSALGHFERVLADPETPKDLLPEVQNEKAQAERNVATLEIDAAPGAQAFVDEQPVEGVARVDPGEHHVRVVLDGKTLLDKTLRLEAGERLRLAVHRPKEVVVPPRKPPPPRPPPPPPPGPSPLWFYVGAGVTAVVGGVTVWSALDTQRAFDDYERDLPGLSQRQADARVAAGHDKELRTNLLLGATALTAAGTAALGLFVVDWGRGRERAALYLGPTGLGAVGRF